MFELYRISKHWSYSILDDFDKNISVFDSNGVKLQDVKINFYHKSIYFTFNNTIQFFDDSYYGFRFSQLKYDEY